MNQKFVAAVVITVILLSACKHSNKHQKSILGKWEMVERKYQCSDTAVTNRYNRYSASTMKDEKYIFEFTSTSMKSFGSRGLLDSMRYELEGDSLFLISDDSKNITREHLNFISDNKLVLTEQRKDDPTCILTAIFKRLN